MGFSTAFHAPEAAGRPSRSLARTNERPGRVGQSAVGFRKLRKGSSRSRVLVTARPARARQLSSGVIEGCVPDAPNARAPPCRRRRHDPRCAGRRSARPFAEHVLRELGHGQLGARPGTQLAAPRIGSAHCPAPNGLLRCSGCRDRPPQPRRARGARAAVAAVAAGRTPPCGSGRELGRTGGIPGGRGGGVGHLAKMSGSKGNPGTAAEAAAVFKRQQQSTDSPGPAGRRGSPLLVGSLPQQPTGLGAPVGSDGPRDCGFSLRVDTPGYRPFGVPARRPGGYGRRRRRPQCNAPRPQNLLGETVTQPIYQSTKEFETLHAPASSRTSTLDSDSDSALTCAYPCYISPSTPRGSSARANQQEHHRGSRRMATPKAKNSSQKKLQ